MMACGASTTQYAHLATTWHPGLSAVVILVLNLYYQAYFCPLSLEQNRSTHNLYGATEALIIRGQSQAKKRVILFLTVFVFSGFFSKLWQYTTCNNINVTIITFFLQIYFYLLLYQWMKSKNYLKKLRIRCTHKRPPCQCLSLVCTCFR